MSLWFPRGTRGFYTQVVKRLASSLKNSVLPDHQGSALFHLPKEVVQFLCVVFLGGYGVALEAIEA